MSVSVAVSGHQPFVLGGASEELERRLRRLAARWLARKRPYEVVTGLAAGWDMACALAAIDLRLPLVGALAFPGQGANWPEEARAELERVLAACDEVATISSEKGDGIWSRRDRWVIDRGDRVLALWNGGKGGTGRALAYAESLGRPIDNLWSEWESSSSQG